MNKTYETPRLLAVKLELGVYGDYGKQGVDDRSDGGIGWGAGPGTGGVE